MRSDLLAGKSIVISLSLRWDSVWFQAKSTNIRASLVTTPAGLHASMKFFVSLQLFGKVQACYSHVPTLSNETDPQLACPSFIVRVQSYGTAACVLHKVPPGQVIMETLLHYCTKSPKLMHSPELCLPQGAMSVSQNRHSVHHLMPSVSQSYCTLLEALLYKYGVFQDHFQLIRAVQIKRQPVVCKAVHMHVDFVLW